MHTFWWTIPTEMCVYVHQKTCAQILIATLFIEAKNLKLPKYPTMDEYLVLYSHNGILYNNEKELCTTIHNQYGWISQPYCWADEARCKEYMYTLWYNLYRVFKKAG